jgi:hypothetical protein
MFGWEPTWDTVVYMACVTALLWGFWAFLVLKEVSEIEWERVQQQKWLVREMLAAFGEKMQEVGGGTYPRQDDR